MSDVKHTPGPWLVSDEYTGIVVDSNGLRVAAAYKDKPYEIYDAHLIAAAPELLKALELLIDDLRLRAKLRGDDCLDVSDGRLYKAQKAIAKARGENNEPKEPMS